MLYRTYVASMHACIISRIVEDIFVQRVEILSVTTKSKKIEIKGGFYNEADMKSELGYTPIPDCT